MKIETLVSDIQDLLVKGVEVSDEDAKVFGDKMASLIKNRLVREERPGTLRMSNIGKPDRQLWYEVNTPKDAEKMHPNSYLKFLYGDIIEELILFLAKLAGHDVQGEQDEMNLHGIVGHRDGVIDGITVDVKSTSPFSFKKFKEGLTHDKDPFGYIQQINNYIHSGKDDPIVVDKEFGGFLAVNKVTGDMHLDMHKKSPVPIDQIIEYKKAMVASEEPPERCFEDEPMGKSGNKKLGLNCSYCAYKRKCWPGLRAFAYSYGPVFLTEVAEEPRVTEIDLEEIEEDV